MYLRPIGNGIAEIREDGDGIDAWSDLVAATEAFDAIACWVCADVAAATARSAVTTATARSTLHDGETLARWGVRKATGAARSLICPSVLSARTCQRGALPCLPQRCPRRT